MLPEFETNRLTSSSDPQQQSAQLCVNKAGGLLVKDEPACKPLNSEQFLNLLDDVEWCSNVIQQKLSLLDGSTYKKSKELYQEGAAKLKASRFESSEDAMSSLRVVVKRAFGCLSVEFKEISINPSQRIASKKVKK